MKENPEKKLYPHRTFTTKVSTFVYVKPKRVGCLPTIEAPQNSFALHLSK